MKKITYITTAIFLAVITLGLSSCLKDSRYVDLSKGNPLVEIPLSSTIVGGPSNPQSEAFDIKSTPTVLPLVINLASVNTLGTDTKVTLGLDQAHLDSLNAANDDAYTLLPAADYSISSLTVTIPAGQHTATLNISINTSLIDASQNYILPLKIVSAGGIQISNYGYILFNIQVKNQYDGEYTVTGTMTDVTNAALTGAYPFDVDLITAGASSNYMYSTYFSGPAHDILSSGSPSYYGSFSPQFNFSGNAVTSVINAYGQPASNGRSGRIDVTGINALTGTPGKKGFVIKVSYVMVQSGTDRTFFNETLTYVGPR